MLNYKYLETYLPVFPGFYGTYFDESETAYLDAEEYAQNEEIYSETIIDWLRNNQTVDYEGYKSAKAEELCYILEDKLCELLEDYFYGEDTNFDTSEFECKFRFDSVHSPKYYNFSNDRIFVDFNCSLDLLFAIQAYIYENEESFKEFLRVRFTTRDGFISNFSNNFEVWEKETNYFTFPEEGDYHLNSLLHFIFINEDYASGELAKEGTDTYIQVYIYYPDITECDEFDHINDLISENTKRLTLYCEMMPQYAEKAKEQHKANLEKLITAEMELLNA